MLTVMVLLVWKSIFVTLALMSRAGSLKEQKTKFIAFLQTFIFPQLVQKLVAFFFDSPQVKWNMISSANPRVAVRSKT